MIYQKNLTIVTLSTVDFLLPVQIVCSGNKAEFKIYLPTQFDGSVQLRKDNALADESCVIQEDTTADYKLYSIAVDISDTGTDAATPCKMSELTVGEQVSLTLKLQTLKALFLFLRKVNVLNYHRNLAIRVFHKLNITEFQMSHNRFEKVLTEK